MARREAHIASCVLYARRDAVNGLVRAIRATGIVDLPRDADEHGRTALHIDHPTTGELIEVIDAVSTIDGVLAIHVDYGRFG